MGESVLVNFGAFLLIAVGAVIYGIAAYGFYQIVTWLKNISDLDRSLKEKEINYSLVEDLALKKRAYEKGLDLDKELIKRRYMKDIASRKSFRQKLEEDVSESFFGKEDVKEKKKK